MPMNKELPKTFRSFVMGIGGLGGIYHWQVYPAVDRKKQFGYWRSVHSAIVLMPHRWVPVEGTAGTFHAVTCPENKELMGLVAETFHYLRDLMRANLSLTAAMLNEMHRTRMWMTFGLLRNSKTKQ